MSCAWCDRLRVGCVVNEGLRLFPHARHCWRSERAAAGGRPGASGMSDRTRGFLIGGAAVFLITPDALLCRLAGANESVAVVTFWRSAFICALCCVITSVGNRGVRRLLRLTRDHCRPLLFIGAISSVTSLGFPLSFMMTGSAEALLIISLNPLWAGVIGWWFLGDVLPLRTRLALAGATASIMLIFVPRVLGVDGRTSREQQPNRLAGDALAFVTGLSLASAMNAMRYYRRKHTQLPAQVVQIIASGTVTLVTAPFCSPSIIPREPGSLLPTAVAMAACISIAYLGFNIAPKYITAADFGILTLVETVLGPLWVFLVLGDEPSQWTLVGGALLLVTLLVHELAQPGTPCARPSSEGATLSRTPDRTAATGSEDLSHLDDATLAIEIEDQAGERAAEGRPRGATCAT